MQGRRLADAKLDELPVTLDEFRPGDYWKVLAADGEPCTPEQYAGSPRPTNLTGTVWGFYSPDGNGCGFLVSHTVREHEDGTISIRPGDGSSNSVLHSGGAQHKTWHGYVERGVWQAC